MLFIFLKNYKINNFLNIIFSTILVIYLNILIGYNFFNSDKLSQIMVYTSVIYICFQFFMIIILED